VIGQSLEKVQLYLSFIPNPLPLYPKDPSLAPSPSSLFPPSFLTFYILPSQEKNLLPPSRRGAPPSHVKVSTVDAFQGAEREVILYSCVRTGGLGFLDSPNRYLSFLPPFLPFWVPRTHAPVPSVPHRFLRFRLNVAITRARRHLVLVGNAQALVMLSVLGRKGGPGGEGLGGGGGGGEGGSKPGMYVRETARDEVL